MSKEYIDKEAAKHIKPNPVLGEWFDHGTDYITKYQALDIVAANNITTEMTLRCYDKIVDGIYKIPPADVKPVVRGKWKQTGNHSAVCTACGKTTFVGGVDRTGKALIHKGLFHFCPNCGADMRKEANDER